MSRLKEEMDLLFEKSLRKETSPEEEKTIEIYLLMDNLPVEHESYRTQKAQKKEEKKAVKKRLASNSLTKRFYTLPPYSKFAILGIASFVALFFAFQRTNSKKDFAFIKGEKTRNPEQIEAYAKEKIRKIKSNLVGCLDPLEEIQNIKIGLEKAEATSELLQGAMNKPIEKLYLKKKEDEKTNNSTPATDTTHNSKKPNP